MNHNLIMKELDFLTNQLKTQVFDLWNKEYPERLCYNSIEDFDKYLDQLEAPEHILLLKDNKVFGWLFLFIRDNQRWFAMIIDSKYSRKGYGSKLLSIAKQKYDQLNGWVIDQDHYFKNDRSKYLSPLRFYEKNDFKLNVQVRLDLDHISASKIVWKGIN